MNNLRSNNNNIFSNRKLKLNFSLSKAQRRILASKARFKVVRTGRQFGKSYLGAVFVIMQCLSKRYSTGWIVAPVFRQAVMLLDKVRELCEINNIEYVYNKSELTIYFPVTNSKVCAMSGDDPNKIRGQTLDFLIIDEAAFINSDIYEEHLEPMVAVRKAPVIFISTPYGRNWFYDLYKYAESGEDESYEAFHYTSADNPLMPKDFLKKVQNKVDPLKYRQEYLADWLEEGGLVFNHFSKVNLKREPEEGCVYIAGLDLAKHVDYTVMIVANIETGELVDMLRITNKDWDEQADLIQKFSNRYHKCSIYLDSTGVGDPMADRLRNRGLTIYPIVLGTKNKSQLVENLVVMLQNDEIGIPNDKEAITEFEKFEYTLLPSGNLRYAAPGKKHDDIVCSMMLLAWGLSHIAKDIGLYISDNVSVSKESTNWELDNFNWSQDKFDWGYES